MDTLDNDHRREEIPDVASPTRDHPLVTETQESVVVEMHRRSWFAYLWERIRYGLRASTFTPEWLNAPWNQPLMGYLTAILTPAGAIILTLLLLNIIPTFAFQGMLMILVILGIALLWGTGPGLFATLWGTVLLNFIILQPRFFWTLSTLDDIFETCFFLAIGITISLVVSRIEHARSEAIIAHIEIEKLVTQLETEKEALNQAQQQSAVRTSEVEAILEAIADGIFFYDAQGNLLRTNAAAQTFNPLTRRPDYRTGPLPERFEFFLPRDEHGQPFETTNLPVSRVLQGETLSGSHTVDIYLRQPDETDILLNVSGAPVHDEEGKIRGAVVVTREMTERRHLEQRTHEALDALLAMTQLIGQGFEKTDDTEDEDREQTGLTAQEVAQRMAEFTRSFLGCQRLSISIVEPEAEIIRPLAVVGLTPEQEQQWWKEQQQQESRLVDSPDQSLVQHLLANEVVMFDFTQPPWNSYPNPYGIRTMVIAPMTIRKHLVGVLTLDYGGAEHQYTSEELALAGAVANLVATVIERDQLLRQRAEMLAHEMVLRIRNKQMTELIALAHDAIIVRTPTSTIISWNHGAERLYGWTEQEAIGRVSHELLQTVFPHSREVTDNLLALHGQWEGQIKHTCRNGAQVIVESRQILVRDESGLLSAILEINRDITKRERTQREREEARANELALREANRRMDEFLGIVSHELRTPLTTIKGNVQLARLRLRSGLREVPADCDMLRSTLEEIQTMLSRSERQVNVQNRMVSDLLDISRLEADKLELRLAPYDLATIVRETVEDQRSITPTRTIHLELEDEEAAPVIADTERVGQVLSNYLTNAMKFSPANCPVHVQLKKDDNIVRVSVSDEGVGLTPSQQERIWELFYQVPGIKRQRGSSVGLGLGLYASSHKA